MRVVKFPISEKARELGREVVANIVALGLLQVWQGWSRRMRWQSRSLQYPKALKRLQQEGFSGRVGGIESSILM